MVKVTLKFSNQLTPSDPLKESVLLIAHKPYLDCLTYEEVSTKLGAVVSQELYEKAVEQIKSGSDVVPLYLKFATIAKLPSTCSRNNTPSQAHTLTKLVKNHTTGRDEYIVIACEYRDVFASACAVARSFPLYSRKRNSNAYTVTVEFFVTTPEGGRFTLSDSDISCITVAADSVRLSGRIRDTPCSEMNTDAFLQEIHNVGAELGITPEIIRGEDLAEKGFGGIYSVGRAAEHPPAMAILSHTVKDAKETIAWVGKGIVFDTGGLFIKARNSMPGMKGDCGGAAGILGAFYLAVKMGFQQNLHAIFCLAENAVGPKATRPDDVITLYSGKTVEVTNTDAEGRLVLGDGVAYAKKDLKATTILDMATLTGAQGTSTGRFHAAILTNSEIFEKAAVSAGRIAGDLIHPVVYAPEIHFSEFNSVVADMKNSVGDAANASVSCAGLFIGAHIGFEFEGNWIHIDMAKPSSSGDRGTGYGVALLNTLFGHLSSNSLLQKLSVLVKGNEL